MRRCWRPRVPTRLESGFFRRRLTPRPQAVQVFRRQGRSGAGLTAHEYATELAGRSGADTPTLRTALSTDGLLDRQREIVRPRRTGPEQQGDRRAAVLSVRTVEGHIYRSSQILGTPVRRPVRLTDRDG